MWSDLEPAEQLVKKHFLSNPNRSLSGTFKMVRRQVRFVVFGDYLLLSLICRVAKDLNLEKTKVQLLQAVKYSEEISQLPRKEKISLLRQLSDTLYGPTKQAFDSPKNGGKTKDDQVVKRK